MSAKNRKPRAEVKKPKIDLEKEAKEFIEAREKGLETGELLTRREYLAGAALSGILAGLGGRVNPHQMSEIKRQAYEWADYMMGS